MSEKLYLSNSGLQRVWTKIKSLLNGKVDKVSGKGLSTNDYTTAEKNKLAGIAAGAEVNVQSDWNQATTTAKDYIKNKPDISTLLNGKVDKVSGKGLSTNDYTAAEKTKLSGIETGANKTTVDSSLSSTSINPVQNKVINAALGDKVDKVSGKRLSTNDYTTAEKNKLASIEQGAKVNVQPDWSQTDTDSDDYIKNKPTIPAAQIQSDWNQNDSTAKDYIKNKPSVPSGQVQSDWEQTDSTAPDYIKNKPSAPSGQVQADWSQTTTTEPDYIKNKPTIPAAQIQADWNQTSSTAKDYIKNKPTIPEVQVQSDWNQTDDSAKDFIKNKPDISTLLNGKVDKVSGKGLSTNDYTTSEKNKLSGIAAGAEVNVQPDWNQTDTTAKDYIKNKPSSPSSQVQADWNQTTTTAPDYIKNKPNVNAKANKNNLNYRDVGLETFTSMADAESKVYAFAANSIMPQSTVMVHYTIEFDDYSDTPFTEDSSGSIILSYSDNSFVFSCLFVGASDIVLGVCNSNDWTWQNLNGVDPSGQVQADWNQTTTTAPDFIKNKPTLFSNNYTELWSGNADDLSGGTSYNLSDDYIDFTHLLIVCMDDEDRTSYSQMIPVGFLDGYYVSFNHVRSNYVAWCSVMFPRYNRFYVVGESYGSIVLSPRAVYGLNLQSHSN